MKYILIFWVTFFNSVEATPSGSIMFTPFTSKTACQIALLQIKREAKNIHGVCVKR